ncbi:uncharacterized protein LOC119785285 [Cyprinodon tularosa]|uniref:uncharacterized protein LOC119785285 n=1 Tax=Cyprinodon tularosa TaxID=77115 RepID=UPI0018E2245A|nr:uncharacterized protein LOC119785285 [Cyprinodon tularosa]
MNSSLDEVDNISVDLKEISLKIQQLEDRRKILCVFQELRNRAEFGQTEEAAATEKEINYIDSRLRELRTKKADLQNNCDNILNAKDNKHNSGEHDIQCSSNKNTNVDVPETKIFFVEPPPAYPAPEVILDVGDLPTESARTQCPECKQFVITETLSSVSSVTWLVCFMMALIGCVAGCCLLPFCMKRFKSTTHRCPKCRSNIRIIKKL